MKLRQKLSNAWLSKESVIQLPATITYGSITISNLFQEPG